MINENGGSGVISRIFLYAVFVSIYTLWSRRMLAVVRRRSYAVCLFLFLTI